ncbi:MAG: T9SS type A sorting domain-containing protein [Actinobacteria bacterium]|nr:T9SS type A sorting domain-containing protein [Actinomycetota bacterium]
MKRKKPFPIIKSSIFTLSSFVFLLSASILPAQISWRPIGPGGGSDLLASAVHPTNPNIVYIGGDIEGIFKTTDGGASWKIINNNLASGPWTPDVYWVQQIKFDPLDPTYKTLYICTSIGLFRTSNGGNTWSPVFPDTFYNEDDFVPVYSVAIDPDDDRTLFVGTQGMGAYRTTDGGQNWAPLHVSMVDSAVVHGIYIDPTSPRGNRTVFLGTSDDIYRSTNNGTSWSAANTGLPHKEVWNLRGIVSAGNSILYLTLITKGTPGNSASFKGGIYKSTNGAASWTDITGNLPKYQQEESLFYFYQKFAVNPLNPEVIYIGTTIGYPEESLAAYEQWGIYKTTNGGASWSRIDTAVTEGWMDATFFDERHALVLEMAPSDTSILYWGRDWMNRSTDAGATWQQIYTTPVGAAWQGNGLELMMAEGMAFDPLNPDIVYVGYDDMGPFRSDDAGKSFAPLDPYMDPYDAYDAAKDIEIDPVNGDIYLSRYDGVGSAYASDFGIGQVWKSADKGNSWQQISAGLPDGKPDLILDPASGSPGSRTLYVASYGNGGYKSTNSGTSWSAINNGLGANARFAWKIGINPSNAQELYLGLNTFGAGGGLYKSTNSGANWTKLTNFPAYDVLSIKFDTANNYVYVAATDNFDWSTHGGLYRSADAGITWTKIFDQPRVADVEIQPTNPNILYAVSQSWYSVWIDTLQPGIYRSLNGGRSWENITANLGHTFILFIKLNPNNPSQLFAGTGGAGLWMTDNALTTKVEKERGNITTTFHLEQNYPNPFNSSTSITFTLQKKAYIELSIYDVPGRLVRTLLQRELENGLHDVSWDGNDNLGIVVSSGVYFYKLQTSGDLKRVGKMLLLK